MPEEEIVQLRGSLVRKGAVVAAALLLLCLPRGPVGFDLRMDAAGSQAVLRLGIISLRVAFDSGRSCPKSNTCHAADAGSPEEARLARQLRG
ncbi:hypothetical protein J2W22_004265 [Sphingomonas kyeonggiensis]|nr:hypothetical protein [Sphingomonas kyeonggiensis]